jgi:uncharacterized damage-inducible protein DinB
MKSFVTASGYLNNYIAQVEEDNVVKALKKSEKRLVKLMKNLDEDEIEYAYAAGKWTIRQVMQHIIDAERVFSFRAIWFARNDQQPLPGFEQDEWVNAMNVIDRDFDEMIDEFSHLRAANIEMFRSFSDEELQREGTASNNRVSVAALGYVMSGHVNHHVRLFKELYLK